MSSKYRGFPLVSCGAYPPNVPARQRPIVTANSEAEALKLLQRDHSTVSGVKHVTAWAAIKERD